MPDAYEPSRWYGLRGWGLKVAAVAASVSISLGIGFYAVHGEPSYSAEPEKGRRYDYATRAKRSLDKRLRVVREFFSGDGEISDLVVPKEKTP